MKNLIPQKNNRNQIKKYLVLKLKRCIIINKEVGLIKLNNQKLLVLIIVVVFLMTTGLVSSQNKEDIAQISLKISNLENLSSTEKSDLQENILRMIYFFDLDTETVIQNLDDIQVDETINPDEIILEFASQLNITIEELNQVYEDMDDDDLDDDIDDLDEDDNDDIDDDDDDDLDEDDSDDMDDDDNDDLDEDDSDDMDDDDDDDLDEDDTNDMDDDNDDDIDEDDSDDMNDDDDEDEE